MTVKNLDFHLRKGNSFVWRFLLLIILIVGVSTDKNNLPLSNYFYIGAPFLYLILLIIHLRLKANIKALFRLLLDLSIIILFSYERNLNNVIIFLPYLILIINSVNFSGTKNRYLLFFLLVNVALVISSKFEINWILHFSLFILSVLMLIFNFRKVIFEFNNMVNDDIGEIFFKSFDNGDEHKILISIKDRINKAKTFAKINEIFIFTRRDENLILIKGTKYIYSNPTIGEDTLNKIKTNKGNFEVLKDEIIIDDISYRNTFWIKLNIADIDYFFMVSSGRGETSNWSDSMILNACRPIFNQLARVYQIAYVLKNLRKDETELIKNKISYVFDSINALHFVKNKLSPVSLKLDLIDRYMNKRDDYSDSQLSEIKKELSKSDPQILRNIFDRAEVLIRGVDNIILKEDGLFKLGRIIDLVKDEWIYQFNNWNGLKINIERPQDYEIHTNLEVLGYIFGDLIANIENYSDSRRELNIFLSELKDYVVFEFLNDTKDYNKSISELIEIARIYNEENNDEIYNRTTKGLSLVRRLSRYKQIKTEIIIDTDNKLYKFYIHLKT